MRIFKRQISDWWLLAIIPLGILFLIPLPFILIVGSNLAGAIIGPPSVLNMTRHQPSNDALAGKYKEVLRKLDGYDKETATPEGSASILLLADGTGAISNLPFEDENFKLCFLSGTVNWEAIKDSTAGVKLDFTLTSERPVYSGVRVCKFSNTGSFSFAELAGQSNPYVIDWDIGDPDSGTGLRFVQQSLR